MTFKQHGVSQSKNYGHYFHHFKLWANGFINYLDILSVISLKNPVFMTFGFL